MPPIAGHQYLLFPPVRPLAERFGAEFFRAIPESPGVYLMSTARDGVLYVGKAKNLRRRLGSYRSGTGERLPPKIIRLLLCVERIDWDVCPDEAAALARESALIRALQPRFNRQGVRPPPEWLIGWHHDAEAGWLTLELRPAHGDGRDKSDPWHERAEVHGPYVVALPAFAALLRQLWLKTHPDAAVVDLPSRLLSGPIPSSWTVPSPDAAARWLTDLRQFFSWSAPTSPDANVAPAPSPLPNWEGCERGASAIPTLPTIPTFDSRWRALDAECLAEFQTRHCLKAYQLIPLFLLKLIT